MDGMRMRVFVCGVMFLSDYPSLIASNLLLTIHLHFIQKCFVVYIVLVPIHGASSIYLGLAGTVGSIIVGIIALIVIIAIAVFLIKVVSSFIVGIIILAIIVGVGLWIYGRIKAR
jgi:hypothetical protein